MDRIFWPLLTLGITFLFIASPGYIELTLGITFVILALVWFRLNEITVSREAFTEKLTEYLSGLESMILEKEKPMENVQSSVTKEETNDSLDKFAKKLIDIENKLNQFKKTLAAAFSSLDERLRSIEEEKFTENENV